MTPDLDALAALLAAATPGDWEVIDHDFRIWPAGPNPSSESVDATGEDAALIVAAVNALPALIEAARREAGAVRLLERLRDADVIFGKGDWPLSQEIDAFLDVAARAALPAEGTE